MKDLYNLILPVMIVAMIACQPQKATSELTGNAHSPDSVSADDFPSSWTKLTDQNGKLVIFHPCDANNVMVEVRHDTLYLNWGEEEAFYMITSMRREQNKIILMA